MFKLTKAQLTKHINNTNTEISEKGKNTLLNELTLKDINANLNYWERSDTFLPNAFTLSTLKDKIEDLTASLDTAPDAYGRYEIQQNIFQVEQKMWSLQLYLQIMGEQATQDLIEQDHNVAKLIILRKSLASQINTLLRQQPTLVSKKEERVWSLAGDIVAINLLEEKENNLFEEASKSLNFNESYGLSDQRIFTNVWEVMQQINGDLGYYQNPNNKEAAALIRKVIKDIKASISY